MMLFIYLMVCASCTVCAAQGDDEVQSDIGKAMNVLIVTRPHEDCTVPPEQRKETLMSRLLNKVFEWLEPIDLEGPDNEGPDNDLHIQLLSGAGTLVEKPSSD